MSSVTDSNEMDTSDEQTVSDEPKTAGQPLSEFLLQLEDYTPTKFISEIANDALQHCKMRGANQNSKQKVKDRRFTLTMEDLTPAVAEYGIVVKKPHYFV
ncbi:unnamed protein product [Trichogramma brassicae]|uniref:Transcription initiation factor TFIID subunit 10 n=1 Tax=Trichogramma brassicae TaxID=86971 RepID=A0A6H5IG27_9HYME|nr:unnamed protein product [Trichogramma brassicae]